jgi:hypothetical protein
MSRYRKAITSAAARMLGGPYGLASMRCFFEISDAVAEVDSSAEIDCVMEDGSRGRDNFSSYMKSAGDAVHGDSEH